MAGRRADDYIYTYRRNHVVVNRLCAGRAPSCDSPFICGSSLFGYKKRGDFRAIAVGEVLRMLNSKRVSRALRPSGSYPHYRWALELRWDVRPLYIVVSVLEDPNFSADDLCILVVDWHLIQ